jgi:ribosomal protein S18 acetylase RimI-like enzyme
VNIRPAVPADLEFVLTVAERLAAFGPPPWRTAREIASREQESLRAHFERPDEGAAVLVAEEPAGERAGFVFLETLRDYFTGDAHGHVGMLAIAEHREGAGAGRALMAAAEEWARARGFRKLTLNVFEENRRARALYARLDYHPETTRYVKRLE